jgi:hypothetical protein
VLRPAVATWRPAMEMVPLSGFSNPATRRSSVVLPQPEAPTTAVIVPAVTPRSMPCSTV